MALPKEDPTPPRPPRPFLIVLTEPPPRSPPGTLPRGVFFCLYCDETHIIQTPEMVPPFVELHRPCKDEWLKNTADQIVDKLKKLNQ